MNSTHNTTALSPEGIRPPVSVALSNFYVVSMAIGTPPFPVYLSLDTDSDDTWVQCVGCENCFEVKGGSFNRTASSTIKHVEYCDDPLCDRKSCDDLQCTFSEEYIGAACSGTVEADSFTFSSDSGTPETFPEVVFGCGLKFQGSFFGDNKGPNNTIAGVFGLGMGPLSFLIQKQDYTYQRFSYCLPHWRSPQGANSVLQFGADARISGDAQRKVQTTSFMPEKDRYYLHLIDISVEGEVLPINRSLFDMRSDGSGGFVIDSGTPHTLLVTDAYNILRQAMTAFFLRYGWNPLPHNPTIYDLCYSVQSGNHPLPSVTFHFRTADLVVDPSSVFGQFGDIFCMIILPINEPEPNRLGAFQQANYRFLFETRPCVLSFVPELYERRNED